ATWGRSAVTAPCGPRAIRPAIRTGRSASATRTTRTDAAGLAGTAPRASRLLLALVLVLAAVPPAAAQTIRYVARLANRNRVGLTVTNYGFFGNNFTSRSSSFEFPLGSGLEHMSRAGLWVGALAIDPDGPFTGVTSALVDAVQGNASAD